MRLRYLHLPLYGPLVDIAVAFGQEELLFGWQPNDSVRRKGAINFVVGVNGTGKSSLLRAIYQTFRALMLNELPSQPVTLAWDRLLEDEVVTALLHYPSHVEAEAWFAVLRSAGENATEADWQEQVQGHGKSGPLGSPLHYVGNGEPITTSLLQAHLPSKLVAYTSGAEILWDSLEQPILHHDDVQESQGSVDDDRPPGWTIEREWEEEQPVRVANALTRFAGSVAGEPMAGIESLTSLTPEAAQRLAAELSPLSEISQKVLTNQVRRSGIDPPSIFRVRSKDLRFASVALSLWQAANELRRKNSEGEREALRIEFLEQKAAGASGEGARRVLNELDWFWPTHISFSYRDADDRVLTQQHEQLLCLLALADEVVQQPRGRYQAVISLGPVESVDLRGKLDEVFPYGLTRKTLEVIADRVQGSPTGAEAVMRVFSSNKELDSTLLEVFDGMRAWHESGLLENITLTAKRLSRTMSVSGELDDTIVTFDHLSDGEQMLLGRTALFFLLRQQDGTLLLLDEPETHFNDVWKREIIDLVDDAILKTTFAQVMATTHTSIALTDVFSSEILRLIRRNGHTEGDSPEFPTFGADPGRILLHVFGSPDVIGSRAAEFLREKLKKEWTAEDRAELERLVDEIGSGWPRAKLTEILSNLDAS